MNRLRPGSYRSGTGFDLPAKIALRSKLEHQMSETGFWDTPEAAQKIVSQLSAVKSIITPVLAVEQAVKDMAELLELAAEENDAETLASIEADLESLEQQCDKIEVSGMLNGPDDMRPCFFGIHAGAGGTESCDWANMLLRMYTRYFEDNKYSFEELDITPGKRRAFVRLHCGLRDRLLSANCRARRACTGWCASARLIRRAGGIRVLRRWM